MTERKEIPYAPGYEIDTQGTVYFNNKIKKRISHNGRNSNYVSFIIDGKRTQLNVGRVLADTFLGQEPDMIPCYRDGDLDNVTLENIYWGTRGEFSRNLYQFRKTNGLVNDDKRVKTLMYRNSKPVYQLDKNTGEVIQSYGSLKEAAAAMDVSASSIASACNHKNRTCSNYKWCFANEYDMN